MPAHRVRHTWHEGQRPQAFRLHAPVVLAARAKATQPGAPDARTGKASAHFHPLAQVGQRHQLALGRTMQVTELGKDGMDALRLQALDRRVIGIHKVLGFKPLFNKRKQLFY